MTTTTGHIHRTPRSGEHRVFVMWIHSRWGGPDAEQRHLCTTRRTTTTTVLGKVHSTDTTLTSWEHTRTTTRGRCGKGTIFGPLRGLKTPHTVPRGVGSRQVFQAGIQLSFLHHHLSSTDFLSSFLLRSTRQKGGKISI